MTAEEAIKYIKETAEKARTKATLLRMSAGRTCSDTLTKRH